MPFDYVAGNFSSIRYGFNDGSARRRREFKLPEYARISNQDFLQLMK